MVKYRIKLFTDEKSFTLLKRFIESVNAFIGITIGLKLCFVELILTTSRVLTKEEETFVLKTVDSCFENFIKITDMQIERIQDETNYIET